MACGGWLRHLEPGFGIIFTGDMLVSIGCLNNIMAIRKKEYSHHVLCQINLFLYPSVETALQEQSTIPIWAVFSNLTEQSSFLILAMILNLVVILISTNMLLFSNYSFFITLFFLFCFVDVITSWIFPSLLRNWSLWLVFPPGFYDAWVILISSGVNFYFS